MKEKLYSIKNQNEEIKVIQNITRQLSIMIIRLKTESSEGNEIFPQYN